MNRTRFRLACCNSILNGFNSVVYRVAKQMDKRIANFINNSTIKLGFCACNDEIDFFVKRLRQIPNHTRESVKYGIHWYHPQLEDDGLQIGADTSHMLHRFSQLRAFDLACELFKSDAVN
ncbi:hypothetical protein D3C78_1009080 [compost metagenome]